MSELLSQAAQKMGVPEALVQRSAEARAKASGVSVDEVLAAWAGGAAAPAGEPAAPPAAAEPAPPPEPAAPTAEPEPQPAAAPPPAPHLHLLLPG